MLLRRRAWPKMRATHSQAACKWSPWKRSPEPLLSALLVLWSLKRLTAVLFALLLRSYPSRSTAVHVRPSPCLVTAAECTSGPKVGGDVIATRRDDWTIASGHSMGRERRPTMARSRCLGLINSTKAVIVGPWSGPLQHAPKDSAG